MTRHAPLRATWSEGQRWETRNEDSEQWVPVGNRGYAEPLWDERQEYRRVEEVQPDDRLPMTVERIMELAKTLPARDTPQERDDYLAAIERMMRRLVASAELTNRCGCNYWTTPTCPARNCPWQGKRPVDRGLPATPVVDQKAAEGSDNGQPLVWQFGVDGAPGWCECDEAHARRCAQQPGFRVRALRVVDDVPVVAPAEPALPDPDVADEDSGLYTYYSEDAVSELAQAWRDYCAAVGVPEAVCTFCAGRGTVTDSAGELAMCGGCMGTGEDAAAPGVKEAPAPDAHDSTGAMAAAWFGTPGAGAAIERVFGKGRDGVAVPASEPFGAHTPGGKP